MTGVSETQINLIALQRVDSYIVEITENASQVALYKYEKNLEKWEGTDIEGSMFLYRRSVSPRHGFMIMNRMNTTNHVEPITSDMQLQLQQPYLLYKNHKGDIFGFWFYESRDLLRITNNIQKTVLQLEVAPPRRQRCASESGVPDILTLLSQAQREYVKVSSKDHQPSPPQQSKIEPQPKPLFNESKRKRFPSSGNSWTMTQFPNGSSLQFNLEEEKTDEQEVVVALPSLLPTPKMFEVAMEDGVSPIRSDGQVPPSNAISNVGMLEDSLTTESMFYTPPSCYSMSSSSLNLTYTSDNYSSSNGFNTDTLKNPEEDRDSHIKGAFLSVLRGEEDLLQRIHEAYVSSLRTHFCQAGKPTFLNT